MFAISSARIERLIAHASSAAADGVKGDVKLITSRVVQGILRSFGFTAFHVSLKLLRFKNQFMFMNCFYHKPTLIPISLELHQIY